MVAISKNQIDKAGDILRKNQSDRNALQLLSDWRAKHVYPLNLAFNLVKKYTDNIGNNALYGQRLKRISSILYKLNRNPEMKLSRMQDIGGCRVILTDYNKLFVLYNKLKTSRSILNKDKNYIHYPKEDGYRSIHLIYECASQKIEAEGLKIEIQLRTKLQHSWATTVEIIDIFENQSLKLGGGSEEWREFFRLVSDEFALLEGLPIISKQTQENKIRIKNLAKKLDVIDKLNNYRSTIKLTEHPVVKHAKYSILMINLDLGKNELIPYVDEQIATNSYLELETKNINNSKVNVLLLKMADVKQIKKTYPNYFADSVKFIQTLQKIIS